MKILHIKNSQDIDKKKFYNFLNNRISNIDHELIIFDKQLGDQNFIITEAENLEAIVPVNFELDNNNELRGSLFGMSIPGPIFAENLGIKKFKNNFILCIEEIDKKCLQNRVRHISINFTDTIKMNTSSQEYMTMLEILTRYKFLNKCFIASRLNLNQTIDEIISNCSKGHKSEIKKQFNINYIFETYQDNKLEYDEFSKLIGSNAIKGYDVFLYNLYLEKKIYMTYEITNNRSFCAIFSIAGETAEYLIDTASSSNHHSLIISAVNFFKSFGKFKYLNLGVINYLENFKLQNNSKKKKYFLI